MTDVLHIPVPSPANQSLLPSLAVKRVMGEASAAGIGIFALLANDSVSPDTVKSSSLASFVANVGAELV